MSAPDPIGVFDSGVGGLSVLRAIRAELPGEHLVYVADSGHAPYGDRPAEFIARRADAIISFLRRERAKAIVVACNTVTGAAIDALRARHALPIVAIEPAVKPAAAATRSGVIGVLATSVTLSSANFARLVEKFAQGTHVVTQPCPGLVEQVEQGDLDSAETRALVRRYLAPLVEQHADTVVLGCTHYAFLRPVIEELARPGVAIVDPAAPVARELRRRLTEHGLLAPPGHEGHVAFWSSGARDVARRVVGALWAGAPDVRALPETVAAAPPDTGA